MAAADPRPGELAPGVYCLQKGRGTAQAFNPGASVPGLPDWQCIPTPGHTPGHVAFFRSSDRVLISGDAVLTVNLNSVRGLLARKHRVSGPLYISTWQPGKGDGPGEPDLLPGRRPPCYPIQRMLKMIRISAFSSTRKDSRPCAPN